MTKTTIVNNMTDYQNKQERLKLCIVFSYSKHRENTKYVFPDWI